MSPSPRILSSKTEAYAALRAMAEAHGGSMWHELEGHLHGAWIVELAGVRRVFPSDGQSYPELDRLFVARIPDPQHALDRTSELVEDAEEQFRAMVR